MVMVMKHDHGDRATDLMHLASDALMILGVMALDANMDRTKHDYG